MNTLQRLLSNTALAFLANIVVRLSTSLLFILIGRLLGPTESGIFSLGTTYFTIVFGLSALGLTELFVREVAPRRESSGRYLANYLAIRVLTTILTYLGLVVVLRAFLPYNAETEQVILILSLAALPEAVFSLCQAMFEAHEQLLTPALAGIVNATIKLGGGYWLLQHGGSVAQVAWMFVIASSMSLLVFVPALVGLLRRVPQRDSLALDAAFGLSQLRQTPGFFTIHLFSLLDYQTDAFLISIFLTETELGYYSAALTITLAIAMLSWAVRAAIYPVMARYYHQAPDKLAILHTKANQYLMALALPVAAGVALLAEPIIFWIFGPDFAPSVPVLRISVWAAVFLLLNVPNARLLLIHNRQRAASGVTAISMGVNVAANLILIPRLGINGAAIARLVASGAFFFSIYWYVQTSIMRTAFWSLLPRPLLATAIMAVPVWLLRDYPLVIPIAAGAATYVAAALLLRVVPAHDLVYWKQVVKTGN